MIGSLEAWILCDHSLVMGPHDPGLGHMTNNPTANLLAVTYHIRLWVKLADQLCSAKDWYICGRVVRSK